MAVGTQVTETDPDFIRFRNALRFVESSGSYTATNPSGALGAYQIMNFNVGPWSKEVLGESITPAEFLASPELQDKIATYKLLQYWNNGDGAQSAAQGWNPTADGRYWSAIQAAMGNLPDPAATATGGKPSAPFSLDELNKINPPLTATQRSSMIAYIKACVDGGYTQMDVGALDGMPDEGILSQYAIALNVTNANTNPLKVPGAEAFVKMMEWLGKKENWQRIGLFALGAVILILMLVYTLRGQLPQGKALKMIGKVSGG